MKKQALLDLVPKRGKWAKLAALAARKGFRYVREYRQHLRSYIYRIESLTTQYSLEYCNTDSMPAYARCFTHLLSKKDV